ncbi:MAG TPA: type II secretion system protein [Patescibacteria group bacterium]|nr:type II secretion system protein [Patescibacteria group bacterium]
MGRKINAFTLVELIIVLAIIAFLAVIAIMYLRGQLFKGNDAARKADLDRIQIASEEYEKDNNCYPPYISCGIIAEQPVYPYLKDVPCDPVTNASYIYVPDDSSTCPKWYKIYAKLENEVDPLAIPGIGPNQAFNYVAGSPNSPPDTSSGTGSEDTGGGDPGGIQGLFGCFSGACQPILWDPSRPGAECDPHFARDDCYGACLDAQGLPVNECVPWN